MSAFRIGDRVRFKGTGETATVVEHISPGFVGVRWDEPHPTRFADGKPTTTTHSCCHVSTLEPADQAALTDTEAAS